MLVLLPKGQACSGTRGLCKDGIFLGQRGLYKDGIRLDQQGLFEEGIPLNQQGLFKDGIPLGHQTRLDVTHVMKNLGEWSLHCAWMDMGRKAALTCAPMFSLRLLAGYLPHEA